jgi:putative transposase
VNRSPFTKELIIGVLREAEAGAKTADPARRHGVSEATRSDWKANYGDRTVIRYQSYRGVDGVLPVKQRALAHQRRRFGDRRLYILLRRDGIAINRKKTQRLYREEGLTEGRRGGHSAIGAHAPAPLIALPKQRWSFDFVHDERASGRRFWVLNVVDDVTRECSAAVPDISI